MEWDVMVEGSSDGGKYRSVDNQRSNNKVEKKTKKTKLSTFIFTDNKIQIADKAAPSDTDTYVSVHLRSEICGIWASACWSKSLLSQTPRDPSRRDPSPITRGASVLSRLQFAITLEQISTLGTHHGHPAKTMAMSTRLRCLRLRFFIFNIIFCQVSRRQ